ARAVRASAPPGGPGDNFVPALRLADDQRGRLTVELLPRPEGPRDLVLLEEGERCGVPAIGVLTALPHPQRQADSGAQIEVVPNAVRRDLGPVLVEVQAGVLVPQLLET